MYLSVNIITALMPQQHLLKTLVNFMDSISGEDCNCKITVRINAWSKMDELAELLPNIEFKSVQTRAYHGTYAWLTKKWNDAIRESPTDWTMISNDDYRWAHGWFPVFRQLADEGKILIG